MIRSVANTPMDQNSPEDIFTLGEYLGREQYGTRPLFYGPAYSSKWPSMWKTAIAYPARKVQTPNTSVKRKPHPTKKTLTLNCRDV